MLYRAHAQCAFECGRTKLLQRTHWVPYFIQMNRHVEDMCPEFIFTSPTCYVVFTPLRGSATRIGLEYFCHVISVMPAPFVELHKVVDLSNHPMSSDFIPKTLENVTHFHFNRLAVPGNGRHRLKFFTLFTGLCFTVNKLAPLSEENGKESYPCNLLAESMGLGF